MALEHDLPQMTRFMFNVTCGHRVCRLAFMMRMILSIVVAIGINIESKFDKHFAVIVFICLLLVYFIIPVVALYFIYLKHENVWFIKREFALLFVDNHSKLQLQVKLT